MTDKEIIKALGCHTNDSVDCYWCPYRTDGFCSVSLCKDVLDLINRQQAEIEHLQGEREVFLEDIHHSADQVNEQLEEIERLEKELSTATNHITRLENQIERLLPMLKTKRAEAIKEFIEEFTSRLEDYKHHDYKAHENFVYESAIEHLVNYLKKEMVGEQE